MSLLEDIRTVLAVEAEAIRTAADRLGANAEAVVELLAACEGRIIVTGMGKSGLIGRKIAATLSSLGSPSYFLHPAEAIHGDLGVVTEKDILIALSNSGETEEIVRLIGHLKRFKVPLIAITGGHQSTLAKFADHVLDSGVEREGDPLETAPMASTTTQLALGDAIAAGLVITKGFTRDQFAHFHPGGSLGKRLLLKVADVMHDEDLPLVAAETPLRKAVAEMTRTRLGACMIVDGDQRLTGIFTDGDLRRLFQDDGNPLDQTLGEVMTPHPKAIAPTALAVEGLRLMQDYEINVLPVVAEGKATGMLHIQDLLKAGLK